MPTLQRSLWSTAIVLVVAAAAPAAPGDPYWVWLQDGSQLEGRQLSGQFDPRQPIRLDGKQLTQTGNAVRVVRDTRLTSVLSGPFVELTNGDVVPGRAERLQPVATKSGAALCLMLAPLDRDCIGTSSANQIRVRLDAVQRIVLQSDRQAALSPALVVLRDGRQIQARTVRFTPAGVQALTREGLVDAALGELAVVHLPDRDLLAGVMRDSLWVPPQPDTPTVRIRTTNGAQLTFRLDHLTADFGRDEDRRQKFTVMPSWSYDGVVIDRDSVVWWTFRRGAEVPLSLLPAEGAPAQAGLHRWTWRRQRNVLGGALATGPYSSELGLGTHAPQEVTFQLPPHAQSFFTTVGLDRAARDGGCVTCRIYRDDDRSHPLWQREFLRGSDGPQRVGPVGVGEAKRLTLTTELAHQRRPTGADPFDVRDHVDWLLPLVQVDLAAQDRPAEPLGNWFPQLAGWAAPDDARSRMAVAPWWDKKANRWRIAMVPEASRSIAEAEPIELTRSLEVSLANAHVHVAVGRNRTDSTYHDVNLLIDGQRHETVLNGALGSNAGPGAFHDRHWNLCDYIGRRAELSLQLVPHGSETSTPAGILWETVDFGPLIADLPADGRPLVPDVPLTALTPEKVDGGSLQASQLRRGLLSNGQPLNVRGYPFEEGFGTPCNVTLTYLLDMSWRRFVAVVGLAEGWQGVGPYEILLDGEPHFATTEPTAFSRTSPGRQLDVEIPRGHNTITLIVKGEASQAAWANAGFMRE